MVDGTRKGSRRMDFSLKPHVWTTNKNDDYVVVYEILTRLPVKSLVRFKCVCKAWKSIIEQDSHFINVYRKYSQARPPRLLTMVLNRKNGILPKGGRMSGCFDFLLADMDCGGATIQNSWSVKVPSPNTQIKGPVRGLLCFVDDFDVSIYNVSTRQFVTPWIRSTVVSRTRRMDKPACQFGFDPDTGEYKAIFVWQASSKTPACCEVLTVGVDSSWRIIDAAVPPGFEFIKSAYVNGSIYWMTHYWGGRRSINTYSESLVAFEIGPEKFRTMRIPEFTLSGCQLSPHDIIIELDGCPTVLRRARPPTLKLWKFRYSNEEEGTPTTATTTSETEDWNEVCIEMPSDVSPWMSVSVHPIPGKDEMIFETHDRRNVHCKEILLRNVKLASFYSYNRVNKTFSKFKIQGIPSIPDLLRTRCHVLVEDLFPAAAGEKKPVKKPS